MGYPAELETIDIVFTKLPGPSGQQIFADQLPMIYAYGTLDDDVRTALIDAAGGGCEFVEIEDSQRRSIKLGEWVDRGDGTWALRIEVNQAKIEGRS